MMKVDMPWADAAHFRFGCHLAIEQVRATTKFAKVITVRQ